MGAISVNFRGKVTSKEANENIQKLKKLSKVNFVEWMPTGFKVGLNEIPCMNLKEDNMQKTNKTCAMIGNNVAVSRVFTERLAKKYDMMYSQRAYVHCTSVKVWKKVSSLKLEKILDSWRRIILMLLLNKLQMRKTKNFKVWISL